MRAFWVLTRMRLLDILRSRTSVAFVLVFPLLLLVVVAFVFSNGHPFEQRVVAVVGDEALVNDVTQALRDYPEAQVVRARDMAEARGKVRARMASAAVDREGTGIRVTIAPRDSLFGRGLLGALAALGVLRRELLEVPRFGYVHYLFPGIITFSVMLSGLFATGYAMVLFRQNRFLKKLATTPLSRVTFVAAQVCARGLVILLQVALLLAAAVIALDVPLTASGALWTAAISTLGTLSFMGIGFVLACVIRTEALVVEIISAVNLPFVLLSEIFFPLTSLPASLGWVGRRLPSTEMVRLLRTVLLYGGDSADQVLPGLAVLLAWTVASFAVSALVFRWHE